MVSVLDRKGRVLMPCTEKRARLLLERGRARVHKVVPVVIRLVDRHLEDCPLQPMRVKLDPGSKTSGIAVVREGVVSGGVQEIAVVNLLELVHRGRQIIAALPARRAMRRRRRGAPLRYRAPRFLNRGNQAKGWLAPSLQHRVDTTMAWVKTLCRYYPITALSEELVRFDLQKMAPPESSGVQYQQGTLQGYEVREYLLEKGHRTCAYCDAKEVPLQAEPIDAPSKGGSNRLSNRAIACGPCNQKKGSRDIAEFLDQDPVRLARILARAKRPLKDAAAVNATRWALFEALKATGLPVEAAAGGRTKWHRVRLGIAKTHALDAACVGAVNAISGGARPTLTIKAMGRGSYQRTGLDKYGFPRGLLTRDKQVYGFQTGDLVLATVPTGKQAGVHRGRVAVRKTGSFNMQTGNGVVQGIDHRHCRVIQRGNGDGYFFQPGTTTRTRAGNA